MNVAASEDAQLVVYCQWIDLKYHVLYKTHRFPSSSYIMLNVAKLGVVNRNRSALIKSA